MDEMATDLKMQFPGLVRISKLTHKQRTVLGALVKGMTPKEIAETLDVGRGTVYGIIDKIKGKMPELMDEAGLNDAALVEQYLKPALSAMTTEFAKSDGRITDSRDVIAWGPRLQALEMALKLKGAFKEKDNNIQNNIQVVVEHIGA